jgi:hypothetical protein
MAISTADQEKIMSLLNDALKRASQSQAGHDTVRIHLPEPAALAPAPKQQTGRGWAVPVVVVLIVALAAFIGLAHFRRGHVSTVATAVIVPPPVPVVPPASKPVAPPPAPAPRAVAVTAHPAPVLPPLKLQGITYYNARWQAIINGKTVHVGDTVNGFRIAMISQNHVSFVAPDGSRKIVPLGE